jgi:hypothetical protein
MIASQLDVLEAPATAAECAEASRAELRVWIEGCLHAQGIDPDPDPATIDPSVLRELRRLVSGLRGRPVS